MVKNLVFDFGGVVVQLDQQRAVEAFRRLGLEDAGIILDKYHQKGIFLDLETGRISGGEYLQALGEMCRRRLSWSEAEEAWLAFMLPVSGEILSHISAFRRDYKVFLLSNTNPFVMGWARSSRFSPEGFPLDKYFDRLFLSYEMGVTKPDRRIFELMCAEGGFSPEETIFIDDSEANLAASRELGFQTFCPSPEEGDGWVVRFARRLAEERD